MTSGARSAVAGLGLAVLYAAVALVTQRLQPEGFRPLFDGFAPPQPYNWVNPPPELAAGNRQPAAGVNDIPLDEGGSQVSNTTTPDSQAVAQLEAGSVPPNPPDTAVRLTLTPADPSTLAPLAPEVRAVSNAYLVSLAYQPSGTPVTQLATPGTVALTASTPGDRLLFSRDGTAWQEHPSRPYGNTYGRFAGLEAAGYYLVAGHFAPASDGDSQDEGPSQPNPVMLFLVGVVPILGAIVVLRPPPRAPAAARSGRPGAGRAAGRQATRRHASGRPTPGARRRPAPKRRKKKRP